MTEAEGTSSSSEGQASGQTMAKGALWMVAMRWSLKLIGLVNTAIIARLLSPGDFGVVAMTMVLADFVTTLADGDAEMALVRSRTADRAHYDTAWTVKILAGLLTGAVIAACSPLLSAYYHDERVGLAALIVALRAVILGFENIGTVDFRRQLNFAGEFRYMVASRLLNFVAGLALVLWWRDWRALAFFAPVSALVTVAVSYIMVAYRPRFCLVHFRWLWTFSQWQILFNSARMLGERCDQFVIGRLGQAADVGNYYVAFDVAMMPTREIMYPVGRALLPNYARLAHDEDSMRSAFRDVLSFAAILSLSFGVGLSVVAEDFVFLILGDQWGGAVPFFRLLGLFGALEGLWLMLDPYLIARHQEKLLAMVNLGFTLLVVPAVVATALLDGVAGVPAARLGVMLLLLLLALGIFLRRGWISASALLGVFWRPALAALAMAGAVHLIHPVSDWHIISLVTVVGVGAGTFALTLFGLWMISGRPEGAEAAVMGRISARFGRE